MRKNVLLFLLVSVFLSCSNDGENKMLRETVQSQNALIESLKSENVKLKEELESYKPTLQEDIQIIGKWLDNRPGANIQKTLNKNLKTGKYYVVDKFDDGSELKEQVRVTKENGLTRFQGVNNDHVEWFIIEKNGDLSMWSQNGKFGTAVCF